MPDLPVFAPSELVLFHGDRFAGRPLLGPAIPLLHTDAKVGAEDLGRAVLEAAILANVQAGAVRFERREGRAVFGLVKTEDLVLVPGEAVADWPLGSLESDVPRLVRSLGVENGVPVAALVGALLREDTPDGWVHAVDLVKDGLLARHLLDVRETRRLGIFRSRVVEAQPRTVALARAEPDTSVRQLLEAGPVDADTRRLLRTRIEKAVQHRTDRSDDMDRD